MSRRILSIGLLIGIVLFLPLSGVILATQENRIWEAVIFGIQFTCGIGCLFAAVKSEIEKLKKEIESLKQ
jgi:glycopeptide antibiotics resistance protein